nr:hypothetical protein [Tanacetum cinerariifolium]
MSWGLLAWLAYVSGCQIERLLEGGKYNGCSRTLDANILRELIGSNGRLILEEIAPSIPRVATPGAPRTTTSDLYDKISQLETRLGEIERMTHRQSYHSDRYAGVLEHIASHYGFTLQLTGERSWNPYTKTLSKMTTLAEHIIVARAENHPPMLEKSMYDSWESRICLFIKGKKHGRMMIDSIDYRPLVYPTVEENSKEMIQLNASTKQWNLYLLCHQDPGIDKVQVAQQTIPQNSAFQTKNLDAYDSGCDDISSAKVVLMENLSTCDLDVLSEVPYYDSYLNDMINQDVQEISYSEQTHIDDYPDNEINSDRNIIPYSQYLTLNKIKEDFGKRFVTQKELSAEQAFWLKHSNYNPDISVKSHTPVRIEAPSELPRCDSLIAEINAKSVENSDLNAQLQEKVFDIAALKNELRKLKGKNVVDTAVSKPSAIIAPGMFKLDIEPISHRPKNNRDI